MAVGVAVDVAVAVGAVAVGVTGVAAGPGVGRRLARACRNAGVSTPSLTALAAACSASFNFPCFCSA
ncbi:hypothetical protein D3C73_1296360 [compost metagenome]